MTSEIQALQRDNSTETYEDQSRGALVRRVIFFQVKLFMDGLRDLVMSPLSISFGALGILFGGRNPHGLFDRLMRVGHVSDEWIDLFGFHARAGDRPSLETMLGDIETILREDHARGGLTAEAERRVRGLAEELRRRASCGQSL